MSDGFTTLYHPLTGGTWACPTDAVPFWTNPSGPGWTLASDQLDQLPKADLVAKATDLGVPVDPKDTKAVLVEKITANTTTEG